MRKSKLIQQKKAFTIIEVLISAAILLITIGCFLSIYVQSSSLAAINRTEDLALNAATAKLEEIANSDLSLIIANYNNKYYAVSGLTPVIGQANPLYVTVAQVAGATDLFNVTMTVRWQQSGRNLTRALNTTLVNRQ